MSPRRPLTTLLILLLSLLAAACAPSPTPAPEPLHNGPTGVSGKVLDSRGQPLAGAWVYAYRSQRSGLRGPADFAARSDTDGHYFLDLVEGEYWLVARLRQGRADTGPPRPGDAWAPLADNPVQVVRGRSRPADFLLQKITQPRIMHQGTLIRGDTGFSGKLVDGTGKPVAGAFALAYRDQEQRRMPDHTSLAVAADGKFTLYVAEPGTYCLAARSKTRGQPLAGEPFGRLGRGQDACREITAGQVLDVGAIVLRPFQP